MKVKTASLQKPPHLNHRRAAAEDVAGECAKEQESLQLATLLPKKEQEEDNSVYKRPETINLPATVCTYYKIPYLENVRVTLLAIGGQELLDRFLTGCFGHLLQWKPAQKCAMALHHVVSRQIKTIGAERDEIWFLINRRKIRFSVQDYALVTGLHFGMSSFDTSGSHDVQHVEVFRRFCGGKQINVSDLMDKFSDRLVQVDDPDGSLYLRVAHVLVLYAFVFGYDVKKNVEPWVWALVDDLEAFARFPWGAYTYKILRSYMESMKPLTKYHYYGPVWVLYVWSLEVIPDLGTAVGEYVDPGAYPRCLRWKFRTKSTMNLRHVFEREVDRHIEITPDDVEECTSYWQSALHPLALSVHYEMPKHLLRNEEHLPSPSLEALCPTVEGPQPRRSQRTSIQKRASLDDHAEETDQCMRASWPKGHRSSRSRDTGKHVRQPSPSSRSRDMGKRVRQPSPSSSSSDGGGHKRSSYRHWMEEHTDMIVEKLHKRLMPTIQKWFEELTDAVRCSSSRRSPADQPTPHHTPCPETRDCDDTTGFRPRTNEDVAVSLPQQQQHNPLLSEGILAQNDPARHPVQVFGSTSQEGTSYPPCDQELARHSMPEMRYSGTDVARQWDTGYLADQLLGQIRQPERPPNCNAESGKAAEIGGKKIKEEQSCYGGPYSM